MIGLGALAPTRLGRSRAVSAFGHRNFRLFFAGQLVSLVGTWMQQVAQGWLVLTLTGDPFWLGVVATAQFLPVMVLGLFAGILADVLPKRQTLIAVQAVMMSLAIVLAILTAAGVVQVWMIIVLALLLGCANAVDMPVRQAFAMEMVGPRHIGNAVAINSAMFNGARVIGPALAGLTIAALGIAPAFAINAASFLAVLVGLSLMRDKDLYLPPRVPRPRSVGAVFENLREGLAFVRNTPLVLLAVTTLGLTATFGMNFQVVIPPLAQALGSDASGYGFLMTASGVGALTAALSLVVGGRPKPVRIALGAMLLGAASILLALSTAFPLSLLLMVFIGAGGIAMAATANATIQLAVPDGLRGRVMSVYTTVFSASTPVGGLLTGIIASKVGIFEAIGIGGALSLLTGVGAFVFYRRLTTRERAVERDVDRAVPIESVLQSTAPSTSAAFNPPKPNEVLSTRR